MTNPTDDRARRSRRTIVALGVVALVALFVVGAAVQIPAMEDDLTRSAHDALSAAQLEATVRFDGQSATLSCGPEVDVELAHDLVAAVHGVRSVALGEGCTTIDPTDTTEAAVDSISADGGTVPSSTSVEPNSTSAQSTTSSTPEVTTPEPGVVTLTFQKGGLALLGLVATPGQHASILTAAAEVVAAENITDGIRDDATVAITDDDVDRLVALLRSITAPLVTAELGWRSDGLYLRGVYTDDEAKAVVDAAAADAGVTALLVPRQAATDESAVALRDEMNAIVAATPIEFGKGQIVVSPTSMYIVERLAGLAKSYSGVIVQVQGHTDSEGDAGRNQTLSDQRAEAVRAELVRLGVPAADITSVGFGESQLITDPNGNELADQSRRVVFDVTTTG